MSGRFQTFATMAVTKTLLMLFNVVFWITGLGLLAIGIWMLVGMFRILELSSEFSDTAPYVMIGTGAMIIVVGLLACCCTVKGHPILLYIYGAFLFVIFVVEVGTGISIYMYRGKLQEGFALGLNQSMEEYNIDRDKAKDFDLMQETLHCCGIRSPEDWYASPVKKIPRSCCSVDKECDPENSNHVYPKGCYSIVVDFLNANIGLVAGSAMGIAFFPLLGVVLSCCLAKNINKTKYEQMA